jgi:hypothetical protein
VDEQAESDDSRTKLDVRVVGDQLGHRVAGVRDDDALAVPDTT